MKETMNILKSNILKTRIGFWAPYVRYCPLKTQSTL